MSKTSPREITQLLRAWRQGDQGALEKLTPLVYADLRRLARHYMGGERPGHTLQTTALINETYLCASSVPDRSTGGIALTSSRFRRS